MDAQELRHQLVESLVRKGYLTDPRVVAAFRQVPRHLFLPDTPLDEAYADEAVPTHLVDGVPISSASQPAILAAMLEQLRVQPGDHVLEIGSGTGYNAALLAVLAGETGRVTSIDLEPRFVAEAREHLDAAGFHGVRTVVGDGYAGYPEGAPYDAIIATAAAWSVPEAWDKQLGVGGRLVVPLAEPGDPRMQASTAFEKRAGELRVTSRVPCGFMPRRPAAAT